MSSPKKNVAYEFDIALVDSADTGSFKASPTIAAGDFQVSTDNSAFANLTTLPVVSPAGSINVKVNLSQAEMNGDKIVVQCIDAAGDEWDDVLIFIDATVANVDDIVRSTTPANTLDVAVTGEAGMDFDNIKDATGNTATLRLKQLDIQNSAGTAVLMKSTGSNGKGLDIEGNGSGVGLAILASSSPGLSVGSGSGNAAVSISNISGHGVAVSGGGAGHGTLLTGGATGHGLYCFGGATSGDGIYAAGQTAGDGMTLVGVGANQYDFNADIQRLLEAALTGKRFADPDTRGWWPLTEAVDTGAGHYRDRSGYANHATLSGSASESGGRTLLSGGHWTIADDSSIDLTGTYSHADVTISDTNTQYEAWPSLAQSLETPATLWCLYRTTTSGDDEHGFDATGKLVVRKSTDSGATWGAEVEVSDIALNDDRGGELLVYDNEGTETLFVVFYTYGPAASPTQRRAYWTKSVDAGATWTAAAAISAGLHRGTKGQPILLSNGTIAIPIWDDVADISYCYITDKDQTSFTAYQITDTNGDETTLIELKTNGAYQGRIAAYTRDNDGKYWGTCSDDYGETWGTGDNATLEEEQLPVSNGTPISMIRTDRDTILAIYTEDRTELEVAVYESFDEAATWHKRSSILWGRSISVYPSMIQLNSGTLWVAWCDNGDTSSVWLSELSYPQCELANETAWLTVAASYKRTDPTAFDTIAGNDTSGSPNGWMLRLSASTGVVQFFLGTVWLNVTNAAINDTNPHRIVVTVSNLYVHIYLDGDRIGSGRSYTIPGGGGLDLLIGTGHNVGGGTRYPFGGVIANVVFESRVWTPEEVAEDARHLFGGTALTQLIGDGVSNPVVISATKKGLSILNDADGSSLALIKVVTDALTAAAAAKLALSAAGIESGAAEAGTLSTTQMTTDLSETTDDHYIGAVIVWTSGVLARQRSDITDSAGTDGLLTFTAVTEAPSAGDTFVIL
jgi:hypothetical protein